MKTKQMFIKEIQEQTGDERIRNLRNIYDEKLKEACPLIKDISLFENLLFYYFGLSYPIDEAGLERGIVNLELKIREDKERRRRFNY